MRELFAFFSPFYLWLMAAVVLAIVQYITPRKFNLVILTVGCLVAAFSGLYVRLRWQPLFFLGGSGLGFVVFRRVFRQQKETVSIDPSTLKNQVGYALETVTPQGGFVNVAGQRWLARNQQVGADPIDIGKPVIVLEVEGNTLVVQAKTN